MLESKKQVFGSLVEQFGSMVGRGTIPILEYTLKDDEFLVVDLVCGEKGIYFNFDDDLPVYFDGEIIKKGDSYFLPFDRHFDNLDHYLQLIGQNITEGYLIPHDLLIWEDQ